MSARELNDFVNSCTAEEQVFKEVTLFANPNSPNGWTLWAKEVFNYEG